MFKRIFIFLLTNIAVIVVLTAVIIIVENVFWLRISSNTSWWYLPLFIFAIIFGFLWSFISLFLSKWTAKKIYNIKLLKKEDLYNLSSKEKMIYDLVEDFSARNYIKTPEIWIYVSSEPNAFATWATKNNSLLAVSSGLLDMMDENEIRWVIGHEMSHIINWDMVTMTLLQWVINTFVIFISRVLAWLIENFLSKDEKTSWYIYTVLVILFEIFFWILASMIVMWFSRYREFRADEWSCKLTSKEDMIAALNRLKTLEPVILTNDSDRFATFKIWSKRKRWFFELFASHPSLDDRIKNLENYKII